MDKDIEFKSVLGEACMKGLAENLDPSRYRIEDSDTGIFVEDLETGTTLKVGFFATKESKR